MVHERPAFKSVSTDYEMDRLQVPSSLLPPANWEECARRRQEGGRPGSSGREAVAQSALEAGAPETAAGQGCGPACGARSSTSSGAAATSIVLAPSDRDLNAKDKPGRARVAKAEPRAANRRMPSARSVKTDVSVAQPEQADQAGQGSAKRAKESSHAIAASSPARSANRGKASSHAIAISPARAAAASLVMSPSVGQSTTPATSHTIARPHAIIPSAVGKGSGAPAGSSSRASGERIAKQSAILLDGTDLDTKLADLVPAAKARARGRGRGRGVGDAVLPLATVCESGLCWANMCCPSAEHIVLQRSQACCLVWASCTK